MNEQQQPKPVIKPVTPEEFRAMADGIHRIQVSAKAIASAGLTMEAIVILLHHQTRVAQRDIRAVIEGLNSFGGRFLTGAYLVEARAKAEVQS